MLISHYLYRFNEYYLILLRDTADTLHSCRCTYMIVRILRTRLRVQQHNKRAFSSIMADIPVYDKHYINGQWVGTLSEKKDEFIEVFDSSVGKRFRDYVF